VGIGLLELVVIAVAALLLLGPDKLPDVIKQLGRFYVQLRRTSTEVRGAFDSVVRQAEEESRLEEIKRLMSLAQSESKSIGAAIQDPHHDHEQGHEQHHPQNDEIPASIATAPTSGSNQLERRELAVQAFDNPHPILPDALSKPGPNSVEPVTPPAPGEPK
jgi:Tat protein translocase TatB subunit